MVPEIEVVHVGSASRDLTDDDPRGWRLGGAVCYAALTTARLGVRTGAVVGADAIASEALELDDLRAAGVDVRIVRLRETPVFINDETPAGRIQTCIAAGSDLPIQARPRDWDRASWSLLPVADELDDAWAAALPETTHLTVGWQGWLRSIVAGRRVRRRPPRPSAPIARADLVGVSRHDVAPNTRRRDLWGALRPGAALLLTDGVAGGRWFRLGSDAPVETIRYRASRTTRVVDPTGAGDVMLAALQAVMLRPAIRGSSSGSDRRADLAFAAAAASLAIEGPGLAGVPTLHDVRARVASGDGERTAGSTGG